MEEATEAHMRRMIEELRWHITNNTTPRDL